MATSVGSMPESGPATRPDARLPWMKMLWFGALLIACYAPILRRLVINWAADEDMGHGFFVPFVAAYIIWQRREALLALKPEPSFWGLVLLVWGAVQMMLGTLGAELFLARTAFLIS